MPESEEQHQPEQGQQSPEPQEKESESPLELTGEKGAAFVENKFKGTPHVIQVFAGANLNVYYYNALPEQLPEGQPLIENVSTSNPEENFAREQGWIPNPEDANAQLQRVILTKKADLQRQKGWDSLDSFQKASELSKAESKAIRTFIKEFPEDAKLLAENPERYSKVADEYHKKLQREERARQKKADQDKAAAPTEGETDGAPQEPGEPTGEASYGPPQPDDLEETPSGQTDEDTTPPPPSEDDETRGDEETAESTAPQSDISSVRDRLQERREERRRDSTRRMRERLRQLEEQRAQKTTTEPASPSLEDITPGDEPLPPTPIETGEEREDAELSPAPRQGEGEEQEREEKAEGAQTDEDQENPELPKKRQRGIDKARLEEIKSILTLANSKQKMSQAHAELKLNRSKDLHKFKNTDELKSFVEITQSEGIDATDALTYRAYLPDNIHPTSNEAMDFYTKLPRFIEDDGLAIGTEFKNQDEANLYKDVLSLYGITFETQEDEGKIVVTTVSDQEKDEKAKAEQAAQEKRVEDELKAKEREENIQKYATLLEKSDDELTDAEKADRDAFLSSAIPQELGFADAEELKRAVAKGKGEEVPAHMILRYRKELKSHDENMEADARKAYEFYREAYFEEIKKIVHQRAENIKDKKKEILPPSQEVFYTYVMDQISKDIENENITLSDSIRDNVFESQFKIATKKSDDESEEPISTFKRSEHPPLIADGTITQREKDLELEQKLPQIKQLSQEVDQLKEQIDQNEEEADQSDLKEKYKEAREVLMSHLAELGFKSDVELNAVKNKATLKAGLTPDAAVRYRKHLPSGIDPFSDEAREISLTLQKVIEEGNDMPDFEFSNRDEAEMYLNIFKLYGITFDIVEDPEKPQHLRDLTSLSAKEQMDLIDEVIKIERDKQEERDFKEALAKNPKDRSNTENDLIDKWMNYYAEDKKLELPEDIIEKFRNYRNLPHAEQMYLIDYIEQLSQQEPTEEDKKIEPLKNEVSKLKKRVQAIITGDIDENSRTAETMSVLKEMKDLILTHPTLRKGGKDMAKGALITSLILAGAIITAELYLIQLLGGKKG